MHLLKSEAFFLFFYRPHNKTASLRHHPTQRAPSPSPLWSHNLNIKETLSFVFLQLFLEVIERSRATGRETGCTLQNSAADIQRWGGGLITRRAFHRLAPPFISVPACERCYFSTFGGALAARGAIMAAVAQSHDQAPRCEKIIAKHYSQRRSS